MSSPSVAPMPARDPESPSFESKPSRTRGQKLLIFAIIIVVGLISAFGITALLTSADQSVTAADGYEYTTSAYAVRFPDEPEVGSQEIANGVSMETAQWQNKQKIYISSFYDGLDPAYTLDAAVTNAMDASGATLVSSDSFDVDGGQAVLTQSTIDGETLWNLIVFGDNGTFYSVAHSGTDMDEAFFDSFRIL